MQTLIKDGKLVLFQGDSVTNAGRNRQTAQDLGNGYTMIAASWFHAQYPEKHLRFVNRGVSGDRVKDLRMRWQQDCLELKPDWVSIMIGINNTWRRYDSSNSTPLEDFAQDYRFILQSTQQHLSCRLILCEPFLLPSLPDRHRWREDLDPKIAVVRNLARQFNAVLVPLDSIFAVASTHREPTFWTPDGVHPTPAGHALIAQSWLRVVQAI